MGVSEVVEPTGDLPPLAHYEEELLPTEVPRTPNAVVQELHPQAEVTPVTEISVCSDSLSTSKTCTDFPRLPDNMAQDGSAEGTTVDISEKEEYQEPTDKASLYHEDPRKDKISAEGPVAGSKHTGRKQATKRPKLSTKHGAVSTRGGGNSPVDTVHP